MKKIKIKKLFAGFIIIVLLFSIFSPVAVLADSSLANTSTSSDRRMIQFAVDNGTSTDKNYEYNVSVYTPQIIMQNSPIQIFSGANANDANSTAFMKISFGNGIEALKSSPLVGTGSYYTNLGGHKASNVEYQLSSINFSKRTYQSQPYQSAHTTLIMKVKAQKDAWVAISYFDKSGKLYFSKKYDFTSRIINGKDSFNYTFDTVHAKLYIDFLIDSSDQSVDKKIENGDYKFTYTLLASGNIQCSQTGSLQGITDRRSLDKSGNLTHIEAINDHRNLINLIIGNGQSDLKIENTMFMNENSENIRMTGEDMGIIDSDPVIRLANLPKAAEYKQKTGETSKSASSNTDSATPKAPPVVGGVLISLLIALVICVGIFVFINRADISEFSELFREEPESSAKTAGNATSVSANYDSGNPTASSRKFSSFRHKIKFLPLYFKSRKCTLIFGLPEELRSGKLIKKVKIVFKSGSNLSLDLTDELADENYHLLKIRYPKNAMRRRKDVSMAYLRGKDIIEQDYFASSIDFINIKLIEKQPLAEEQHPV